LPPEKNALVIRTRDSGRRTASLLLAAAIIATAVLARPRPPGESASAALLGHASEARSESSARASGAASAWTAPATLSSCPGISPRVLFPSDTPSERTGPGAVVWSDGAGCTGGRGARIAALGASELPLAPVAPRTTAGQTLPLRGPLGATTGPHGQIILAGFAPGIEGRGKILQGAAGGPFTELVSSTPLTAPFALTTAYLGDFAVAIPARRQGPAVQVERFFSNTFSKARFTAPGKGSGVRDLTVAMDYRSDALAAWVQGSSVYAQDLPASGVKHPVQRIGVAGKRPILQALLSDDNRGMVVWQGKRGTQTSIHFDYSAAGVKFGAPRLLEQFNSPDGLVAPPSAPRLIRLSSESVMLAWTGMSAGHWAVRTAAVDQNGIGAITTIGAPEGDALLDGLAPGPRGEAMLLFSAPESSLLGRPNVNREALYATRGVDTSPDRTLFAPPQLVAPAEPVSGASIGVDPSTGAAVAAWSGQGGAIDYAVHPAG
jgi:hypothetical protein